MHVLEIDTPALVVDLDIMERNLRRAADYARQHGLRLRPHTKTHKSLRLAWRQVNGGADGLTVAKVGEAEIMAAAEPATLLVAYPVIGAAKLLRLTQVARRVPVIVALDSAAAARQLAEAAIAGGIEFGVYAEFDAGLGRAGVDPGLPLLSLVREIQQLAGLRFAGLAFYPGHIRSNDEAGHRALNEVSALVAQVLAEFAAAGIEVPAVSGGSTPTLFESHRIAGLTEIRPGTYIFNDLTSVLSGACTLNDCAATIHTTVVSTARPGQILLDGGSKTFSSDRLPDAANVTFGSLLDCPGTRFHKMNEEHGYVDITGAGREFHVGDRVRVLPNHICTAVNLHDRVYGIRGETVEEVWPVDARGKLQ